MVGQNKGKEGKSPRFDIGYKRNSTHECENYDKKNERKGKSRNNNKSKLGN